MAPRLPGGRGHRAHGFEWEGPGAHLLGGLQRDLLLPSVTGGLQVLLRAACLQGPPVLTWLCRWAVLCLPGLLDKATFPLLLPLVWLQGHVLLQGEEEQSQLIGGDPWFRVLAIPPVTPRETAVPKVGPCACDSTHLEGLQPTPLTAVCQATTLILRRSLPPWGCRVRGVKGDGGTGRAQMGQMSMGGPVRTGGLGRMTGVFPKEPSQ